ncbi:hypothetical protein LTR56_020949 [Elasticomyces elasticus]|nr:hypothetical protein LTR56_020949 [Elasticomyces elasticus]KAK3665199.1 hypothetical protein LTR22_004006 [Elasticomyces elasticus]KAK4909849.1 hypothetical protein LTR49_021447 [Elasticomyces elasticus]KAK5749740.1 hypothetical protein LTS12_020238 [Elasticomyces elasticus]
MASLRFARLLAPRSLASPACRSPSWKSRTTPSAWKAYSTETASTVEAPDYLDESERKIFATLKAELQPTKLEVQDVSGGCGSMYALDIVSDHFKGLPVIKQHRLVNKVLGEEIKKWHGVQLKTRAP